MGRAIGLMDPADPGRDGMLVEQASSLMWAGRVAAARQMCSTLLERAHAGDAEGPARLCLGYALVAQSQQRDALPELERAAESPVLTDAERAGARAWAGYAQLSMADLDGASATASDALSAAPADPLVTSVARATQALVTVHRWHPADALEIIDDAVRLADQSPGRQGHRFPINITRGFILTELDRLDEARSTLDAGQRIGEELGIRWQLPNYQMISAVTRFLAGEWDDAIAEVEAARELADETGESYSLILGHCALTLIWVHRNDLAAPAAASGAMDQLGEPGPRYRALWAMWAHAVLLEAARQFADAFALLAECWDRCASWASARLPGLRARPRPARSRQRRARTGADGGRAVAGIAERQDVPSLTGAALHCHGLVSVTPRPLRGGRRVRPGPAAAGTCACQRGCGHCVHSQGVAGRPPGSWNRRLDIRTAGRRPRPRPH